MRLILVFAAIVALCATKTSLVLAAATPGSSASTSTDPSAYQEAIDAVAGHITKGSEKAEQLANEYMSAVDKDPGALITRETMKKIIQGSSFLPQKSGTRTVSVQSEQGNNGLTSYQPAGWKITETMSGSVVKAEEPTAPAEPIFTYPFGLGPLLMNQCTQTSYDKSSPCYNSKLFNLQNAVCLNQIDAANYIGVGFDGRGYYNAQSRKASLVQRTCANKAKFLGDEIPDAMNIFGVYETVAETKSFQSASDYMSFIREKAGLSEQKNLFTSEAAKFLKAESSGFSLGGLGAIAGAAIGALAGGPAGAVMGASVGGAIGGSIGGGSGSGSGGSIGADTSNTLSISQKTNIAQTNQGATRNFFAIMYVNVILYDLSLDEVKPNDLSLSALKDYMDLPASYYSIGANVKYQNFLLRWGTHFIRSAKFGGQLKIIKTTKTNKVQSQEQFARIAETEFQSMFATLEASNMQKKSGHNYLIYSDKKQGASQEASGEVNQKLNTETNSEQSQSTNAQQSEFTQTTVEAQGGTPEIAEALVDFYTPAFKQIFHDWLVSIKDYPKPFEFQLRAIDEMFNMNMDDLFPGGKMDFGCVGGAGGKVEILVEPKTNRRYYIDVRTNLLNSTEIKEKIKVFCKYSELDDFKVDLDRRRISLERAIGVYMAEGPFPTSSFELKAGEPGCEEATLGSVTASTLSESKVMRFSDMKKLPFLIAFDMPLPVQDLIPKQAKFRIIYKDGMWFATEPSETKMHLYDGCRLTASTAAEICFRNIILTYDKKTGLLEVNPEKFNITKIRIPSLPDWLSGSIVARVHKLDIHENVMSDVHGGRASLPCNIRWLNSHRLDPQRDENCIHFTAASAGDIFVIFSAIPKDHTTWYYLQINPEGVSFYHAMKLVKRDNQKGMGILGDTNLFQSFFVCVIQKSGDVMMQYGKADPESEVGTVYSGYKFARDSQYTRLSFYTFGSGSKEVSLMDIRLTRMLPKVVCISKDYEKVDGQCVLKCHAECDNCYTAHDNKACQQCKHLRVETGSGTNKMTECLAECPAGRYLSSTRENLCVPCLAGTFKVDKGNGTCSKCPAGFYSDAAGATKCTKCDAGNFNDQIGQAECKNCTAGTYSGEGATSCMNCSVGSYSVAGQANCSLCPFGYYGISIGQDRCTPCAEGYFADSRGQTNCTLCPAGTSSINGSRSCINSCKQGEFSPEHGVPCKKCSPGTYAESAGLLKCIRCSIGHYQPSYGQASCIRAAKGTYVAGTFGSTSVEQCPKGTANPREGLADITACQTCTAGTYSYLRIECRKCSVGHFSSGSGSEVCSKCPKGRYAATIGAMSCMRCIPGTFAPAEGSVTCTGAPKGTYVSIFGSTNATKCAAGSYNPNERQTSSSACQACPAGSFSSSSGSSECTKCKAGSVAASTASTSCILCPVGSYAPEGVSTCTPCTLGYYAPTKGSASCLKCPQGSIASNTEKSKCYKFGECYFTDKNFVSVSVNRTTSSKTCQSWAVHNCSSETLGKTCHVPQDTAKNSQATDNACRTFTEQGGSNKPWCYTTTSTRWEYCDIPLCGPRVPECYPNGTRDYVSGIAVTKSGKSCQGWEIKTCPESTKGKTCHDTSPFTRLANKIGNTCRIVPTPFKSIPSITPPWCYTTSSTEYESCNIPVC